MDKEMSRLAVPTVKTLKLWDCFKCQSKLTACELLVRWSKLRLSHAAPGPVHSSPLNRLLSRRIRLPLEQCRVTENSLRPGPRLKTLRGLKFLLLLEMHFWSETAKQMHQKVWFSGKKVNTVLPKLFFFADQQQNEQTGCTTYFGHCPHLATDPLGR